MINFASALYLGMHHPSNSLRPWKQLTLGVPAALAVPPEFASVARSLAQMMGCEHATLGTSTLHIFLDLFEVLANKPATFLIGSGIYPIARWGVERVASKGVKIRIFPDHDLIALKTLLKHHCCSKTIPIIVTDGLCPATGRVAPLKGYLELIREKKGFVVVDDTQAMGILGHSPNLLMPYGIGGGGSLAWHNLQGPELIVGSSLAKGFGVPIAVLGGAHSFIKRFEAESAIRVHSSPPATALIHAAQHAIDVNISSGNDLRMRLLQRIRRFRECIRQIGLSVSGGFFPVQTLNAIPGIDAVELHERLLQFNIRTVLHRPRDGHNARLSFLITALHSPSAIDDGVEALKQACTFVRQRMGGNKS
jgi:8-amino-7-oxononanoate synthase